MLWTDTPVLSNGQIEIASPTEKCLAKALFLFSFYLDQCGVALEPNI